MTSDDEGARPSDALLEAVPATALFEGLPVPLLAIDATGVIVAANAAMSDMTGFPVDELRGRRADWLIPDAADPNADTMKGWHLLAGRTVAVSHATAPLAYAHISQPLVLSAESDTLVLMFEDLTEPIWLGDIGTSGDGSTRLS